MTDEEWKRDARKKGFGGKESFGSKSHGSRDDRKRAQRSKLEDNYRPKKGRFASRENDEAADENPLARRRNEDALKSLVGKRPSLPPSEDGVVMRSRKGWKKK